MAVGLLVSLDGEVDSMLSSGESVVEDSMLQIDFRIFSKEKRVTSKMVEREFK